MTERNAAEDIALYGTREPDEKGRMIRAGALSVEFENGQLRYVRCAGREVMRAIAFIVRDEAWGTYGAEIKNLEITEASDKFHIGYEGACADGAVRYAADINGTENELIFAARVSIARNFRTNRTGFVILHPLEGCAGRSVDVEHVDGSREQAAFPQRISAYQPFFGVRALKHEFAPGSFVTARLEGDTFEMEDQRNWSDASFKTYVRPIGLPWPYELAAEQSLEQRVTLTIEGKAPSKARSGGSRAIAVKIGRSIGQMPRIGLEIPAREAKASHEALSLLKSLGPRLIVGEVLRHEGHGRAELASYGEIARACNAELTIEAALPGTREPGDEARELAEECAAAGAKIDALTLWSAPDLKGVLPGSTWPVQPPLEAIRWAALTSFPGTRIGGGAHAFFTELNRRRPLTHFLDYISFTVTPIVHAADDRSVMETLETLPAIIESAGAIASGKPWRVGPSSIGTRDNPYGPGSTPNPDNARVCMAEADPRHRALFGAAWTLGYLAAFSASGAEAIVLGTSTGPRGAIHRRSDKPLPWYDDADGRQIYPVFHVIADVASASGAELISVVSSAPRRVAALGWRDGKSRRLLLANLTPATERISLAGTSLAGAEYRLLDSSAFAAATSEPNWAERAGTRFNGSLELSAYAVAFATLGPT